MHPSTFYVSSKYFHVTYPHHTRNTHNPSNTSPAPSIPTPTNTTISQSPSIHAPTETHIPSRRPQPLSTRYPSPSPAKHRFMHNQPKTSRALIRNCKSYDPPYLTTHTVNFGLRHLRNPLPPPQKRPPTPRASESTSMFPRVACSLCSGKLRWRKTVAVVHALW
ncbi:hypothetical protein T440DRAFT_466613 [Plenodomus tracheiphilus IPT5]|uniref:Uncharacterized protein n=1 Tax=Plenodomus tracheiphilus IPT5 TaxID=1408161 RepID=A0A6A7BAA1_9PLEO|nr:hypothetical protein T440DRAFT_466613 [Plenodomus tracheiphilus IPT5]